MQRMAGEMFEQVARVNLTHMPCRWNLAGHAREEAGKTRDCARQCEGLKTAGAVSAS